MSVENIGSVTLPMSDQVSEETLLAAHRAVENELVARGYRFEHKKVVTIPGMMVNKIACLTCFVQFKPGWVGQVVDFLVHGVEWESDGIGGGWWPVITVPALNIYYEYERDGFVVTCSK